MPTPPCRDPEGRVKHILAKWATEGSAEPSWLQPADLLVILAVIAGLAKGAGRGVMWIIARRAASRAAARGASRELAEVTEAALSLDMTHAGAFTVDLVG
jgi:hypothetical protein